MARPDEPDDDDARRADATYELAESGDPGAADALRQALDDPDERVRATAAAGLARLGDPQALDACTRLLDAAPDPMHGDLTPAVNALGAMGPPAVRAVLGALADGERLTRLHAQRVLEDVVSRSHGFVPGQGFPSPGDDRAAAEELTALGYDFDADPDERTAAVARVREWLEAR